MSERSNEDIIRIVGKWQANGLFHELTCGADSRHLPLEAVERDGKVVLVCPTCAWTQEHIHEAVLGAEPALDFSMQLLTAALEDERIRQARSDVWWMVAMIVAICAVLGGLFWGLPYFFVGLLIGAAAAAIPAYVKLRKIEEDSRR